MQIIYPNKKQLPRKNGIIPASENKRPQTTTSVQKKNNIFNMENSTERTVFFTGLSTITTETDTANI